MTRPPPADERMEGVEVLGGRAGLSATAVSGTARPFLSASLSVHTHTVAR